MELVNVGRQTLTLANGTTQERDISVEQDRWDNGFQVGVLGEMRLSKHIQLRVAPSLYFGARHLTFRDHALPADDAQAVRTQTLKTIYVGLPINLIAAGTRQGNRRPYVMAGVAPMVNFGGRSDGLVRLKRREVFAEVGVGADFYLPFFKLRPELKFMYGLTNSRDDKQAERLTDEASRPFALAPSSTHSKMVVLTFYFE